MDKADLIMDVWIDHVLVGVVVIVATIISLLLVRGLGRRAVKAIGTSEKLKQERRQRIETLVQIMSWGASILMGGIALLMILSEFGVDITPLLTSAGIAGLVISLGAQTLMKDFLGGFFILMENQYTVGDVIQIGMVTGTVERLTFRVTHMRDINGNLIYVPNGEIRIVSNQTREWSKAVVDLGVGYEVDLERAMQVIAEAAQAFSQDQAFSDELVEPAQLLGPLSLGDWAINVRVTVKTHPGKQWQIGRELRKHLLAACQQADVDLPYPRQEVIVRQQSG